MGKRTAEILDRALTAQAQLDAARYDLSEAIKFGCEVSEARARVVFLSGEARSAARAWERCQ